MYGTPAVRVDVAGGGRGTPRLPDQQIVDSRAPSPESFSSRQSDALLLPISHFSPSPFLPAAIVTLPYPPLLCSFICLEYLSGGTLRGRLDKCGGGLGVGQAVKYGMQLASALAYM